MQLNNHVPVQNIQTELKYHFAEGFYTDNWEMIYMKLIAHKISILSDTNMYNWA